MTRIPLTRAQLIVVAAAGSAAMLIGAWIFQYFGFAPCKLCIWQRWPHGIAVLIGAVALVLPYTLLALLGALSAATTGAIGVYHSGVERGWWQGPASCTSGDIGGLSTDELMETILAAPLVRCDEIPWQMLGVSMANLNALISFGLAVIWLLAAHKSRA